MTTVVDTYVAQLQSFLVATDELTLPLDAEVEKAIDYAESLIDELSAPVRVAVAGARQTGKSTLVNLLAGVDIVPSGPDAHLLPPVILRYSETERTLAGWWDRAEKVFDGLDVSAALAESPDVVSFEIDCDALRDLWLIDVSGVDHRSRGKEARFALSRLADVLLWCSDVTKADIEAEQKSWQLLPPHLRKHSILVLSHIDQANAEQSAEVQNMVSGQSQTMFRQVVPISVSEAWQALVQGDSASEQQWIDSGAGGLIDALMYAVETYRADQLQRARRAMMRFVAPAMAQVGLTMPKDLPVPPSLVDTAPTALLGAAQMPAAAPVAVAPQAPVEVPEPVLAQTDPMDDLLGKWHAQIQGLKAQIASDETSDVSQVIEAAHQIVNAFLDVLAGSGTLSEGTDWLISEFEKADDLLILLQFEDAETVVEDAMRIVWQLTDCLSWAGLRDADYGDAA